jgi:hypothetical protein
MYSAKDKHFRSFPIGTEVPCSLLSNITYKILPSFHALTTLPLLFSELGKKYICKDNIIDSWQGVLDTTLCNTVCECIAVGRWFSPVLWFLPSTKHINDGMLIEDLAT